LKPLIIHDAAEFELWQAIEYYESIRSGLGADLIGDAQSAMAAIQESPDMWPKRKHNTRIKLLNRFPFGIYYLELPEALWIVAYAHLKRSPYYWRSRFRKAKG
jgi:toxin ParE1/3/4